LEKGAYYMVTSVEWEEDTEDRCFNFTCYGAGAVEFFDETDEIGLPLEEMAKIACRSIIEKGSLQEIVEIDKNSYKV
jgi:hypothetical protein